jgi:outer membrane protein OmpA-like peptidoglycan-associated protein
MINFQEKNEMIQQRNKWISAAALVLIALLSACGAPKVQVAKLQATDDPSAQLTALTSAVFEGRQQQLNVLSPDWYAKAGASLEKARKGMSVGESAAQVLENVAYGQAYLDKARDYARVAKTVLGPAIAARNAANKVDAMEYAEEYKKIEKDFLNLTRSIEGGNVARAKKGNDKVAQAYSDLELRAIKDDVLEGVRNRLAKAEKGQALKIAPVVLTGARKALAEADQYITEHRYEREQMQRKAADAMFQAKRLEQVMFQVRKIEPMSPEEKILWVEDLVQQTTRQLNAPDMRDQEWNVQLQNVHASIASLQKDNLFLQKKIKDDRASLETRINEKKKEIIAQKKQIAILEGESKEAQKARELLEAKQREANAKLEAEHRFQMQFVEVQNLFTKEQAEVYKQNHDLVIRLKAIRFPVGQAFITPDNYELLSTVRSAVHTFGEPDVVIEGHTDSTGSAAANEQLSQRRANAVREYFVANEAIRPEKVMAIGYGAERPLSKNDTPAGRAINRRIDVIIRTAE